MAEPPYRRIAAELRGQIERGELTAGQRIPSTRELTGRWGVAMATATKVLAALRQDGLVHPGPGGGTGGSDRPVAPAQPPAADRAPASRSAGPRPATDRGPGDAERIVAAAITVADAGRLGALSLRP